MEVPLVTAVKKQTTATKKYNKRKHITIGKKMKIKPVPIFMEHDCVCKNLQYLETTTRYYYMVKEDQ